MSAPVLVLHGPVQSRGINPVSQRLYPDPESRERSRTVFDSGPTIVAVATAFRAAGCKIIYSGWEDDAEWLNANAALFDHLVLSDQNTLRTETVRDGHVMVNNKEKLYYGSLRGLELARAAYGDHAIVFRLRSDMAVDYRAALRDMARIQPGSRALLIEFLDVKKTMFSPDFMLMGEARTLHAVYERLYTLSRDDYSYHVSSHIDHMFAYLFLRREGVISEIFCMSRALFDTQVWRGVPRYLEHCFPGFTESFFFDGMVAVPPEMDLDALLADIPPMLAGRPRPPAA